jgi:hypothetical protein
VSTLKNKKRTPIKTWKWLYAYGAAVVLFAAYIPTFIHQTLYSALPGVGSSITLTKFGDMASVLFTFTPEWKLGGWLSLLIIAGIILVSIVGVKVYRLLSAQQKQYFLLLVALTLVPIAFYTLTSLPPRTPIFINRYLAHVSIFIYMLVGVVLALGIVHKKALKGRVKNMPYIAYTTVLVIVGIGMLQLHATGNFVFERMQYPQTRELRETVMCDDDWYVRGEQGVEENGLTELQRQWVDDFARLPQVSWDDDSVWLFSEDAWREDFGVELPVVFVEELRITVHAKVLVIDDRIFRHYSNPIKMAPESTPFDLLVEISVGCIPLLTLH